MKKMFIILLSLSAAAGAEMASVSSNNIPGTSSTRTNVSYSDTNLALSPDTALLEEGKALYENGQLIAALGKFMTVLRKDPRNPEARQYLRMIVDIMRQNPAISSSQMGKKEQAVSANPLVQEEIRRMLQLRSRLTMDLRAIPSVQVETIGNSNQVAMETALFFADKSGGLKEQGVPILDRVAAWLKTYGQQPVIIHCFPEELQDASTNGSLFLHRYSELFNFFVEEKKLPAQRFVSADLLGTSPSAQADGVQVSTASRIVIETIGSQSAMQDTLPSNNSPRALSQWLENSITLNRKSFNPEEGEWVNLDLAALSRMGLRSWSFKIVPADGKAATPALYIDGKGNLLRRVGWDGHDQKTGDFVAAGSYLAKLTAVNSDGAIKNQEEIVQVERTTKDEPALANKPKPKAKSKAKPKTAKKPKGKVVQVAKTTPAVAAPPVPKSSSPAAVGGGSMVRQTSGGEATSDPESLTDSKPVAETPAAPAASDDSGDSVHAIWKQVVQFETDKSDLMPTVKSSLERIGKTLEVYPLQKVRITGFAMDSEANAPELARQRAEAVRSILVNEYHVDKKRVIVAGGKTTSDANGSKVEMSIIN